jgi:hypothetical protein
MNIVLPPDIEQALLEQARQQGTTPELLVLDSLRQRFLPPVSPDTSDQDRQTLADFLQPYIGVLHSSEHVPGGADLSRHTGRKFTDGMIKKREKGKL